MKRVFILLGLLSVMFSVSVCAADYKMEGSGYNTPQEAAEAYIQGLIDNDVNEVIASCAIESYIERFDLSTMIERMGVIYMTMADGIVPSTGEFTDALNLEMRRSAITRNLRYQYLVFSHADSLVRGDQIKYEKDGDIVKFMKEVFPDDGTIPTQISFTGNYIDPDDLTDGRYSNERGVENHKKQNACYNVDGYECLAPVIEVAGEEYILCLELGQYGDRWYVLFPGGYLGALLAITSYSAGVCPVAELS